MTIVHSVRRQARLVLSLLEHPVWAARVARYLVQPPRPSGSRDDREFAEYLKGCSVALVGPASTIAGSRQGDRIDGYDRVIRLNHALPIPPHMIEDIGERTDVLYHHLNLEHPRVPPLKEFTAILLGSVRWICCTFPYLPGLQSSEWIDAVRAELHGRLPFRAASLRHYSWLRATMRTSPNGGISAIQDLLRFKIDKLYITGFSFFQTNSFYYDGYQGMGPGAHGQQPQIEQVRRWVQRDSRIHMDKAARRILFPSQHDSAKELD
ncbi:MAG: glycosyltransferase family 29 protein [Candidatus Bipolaricaulota bacterium]